MSFFLSAMASFRIIIQKVNNEPCVLSGESVGELLQKYFFYLVDLLYLKCHKNFQSDFIYAQ